MKFVNWEQMGDVSAILVEKHDRPLIFFSLAFPVGAYADPSGKEGLTHFLATLCLRGTRSHSRSTIEEKLDHLGARLVVETGFHSTIVKGQVLARNFDEVLNLTTEILTEPALTDEEFDKLRKEENAYFHLTLERDMELARTRYYKYIYGNHPYHFDPRGTPESLARITRDDLLEHFRLHFHRKDLVFGASGGIHTDRFHGAVSEMAARFPVGTRKQITDPLNLSIQGREVILIDKPDRTQVQFYIGQPGVSALSDETFPLEIFGTAFAGKMFQAKYMQEIRVKRGWAYGAYGQLDARRDGGSFYLFTFPKVDDAIPAIQLSLELLKKAPTEEGIADSELDFAKNYLVRSFPFQVQVPEAMLSEKIYHRLIGHPDNYLETYRDRLSSVSPADARSVFQRNFGAENVRIIMLCSAKDFEKDIGEALGASSVKVVPHDQF